MSVTPQVADPAAVAWRPGRLKKSQGCMRLAPDPADPLAVAAYDEARRQLAAQATAAAPNQNPHPDLRRRRTDFRARSAIRTRTGLSS